MCWSDLAGVNWGGADKHAHTDAGHVPTHEEHGNGDRTRLNHISRYEEDCGHYSDSLPSPCIRDRCLYGGTDEGEAKEPGEHLSCSDFLRKG